MAKGIKVNRIYSKNTASVTELKNSPGAILEKSSREVVVILSNNKPLYYIVDPEEYERMVLTLETFQRASIDIESVKGSFKKSKNKLGQISTVSVKKILSGNPGEFIECE